MDQEEDGGKWGISENEKKWQQGWGLEPLIKPDNIINLENEGD